MYDYIFAGCGVAAILLLDELLRSPLRDSHILLIDRTDKQHNDRTLCFWEEQDNDLEKLVFKSWKRLEFVNDRLSKDNLLYGYRYKCIRSIELYTYLRDLLTAHPNIHFVQTEITKVATVSDHALVQTANGSYTGKYAFDSRIDPLNLSNEKYVHLQQYFRGWFIHTSQPEFTAEKIRMFDFHLDQGNDFRFIYLLPFSDTEALIELVTLKPTDFDSVLKDYLTRVLHARPYYVSSHEGGVNHLTDASFDRRAGSQVMRIGAAGGMIKPSSGYGFLRMQHDAQKIVDSLVHSGSPFYTQSNSRFYHYCDSLLLQVLRQRPQVGVRIFSGMFKHNQAETVLRFLDERASPWEIIKLMLSMYPLVFVKQILSNIWRKY